jgi:hypothetical protein
MNKILILLVFISQSNNLFSQPGDKNVLINQSAYSKPFLDCVTDEKDFAKYAVEAHQYGFNLMDHIKCKLHIPSGINKIWKDIENSKQHKKGDFNYTHDFWIGIRFNLYIDGTKVSTAYHAFEKNQVDTGLFTFFFDLDPVDFSASEGDIHYAYVELLKNLTKGYHRVIIEAAMPSKNLVTRKSVPIVSGGFIIHYDTAKLKTWKELMSKANNSESYQAVENSTITDYNIRLKYLADSTMKSVFGETGFSKNFTMSCLQNPCEKGYLYANTFESDKPCSTEPQDNCKEAIITYSFISKNVPLTMKMLITIKENGNFVNIENNPYGKNEITIEKQNLLSISEIQKIINKKFPKDSLEILPFGNALGYSNARVKQPEYKDEGSKWNRDPGYRLIKETKAGENWENGFIYRARSNDQKMLNRVYHFDAVAGELLWITEIYNVTNENHSR